MKKIAIDIDNTICNTTEFFGDLAIKYDREILHKNSVIDFSKTVPRSAEWTREELAKFIEMFFNKESIRIPIKKDAPLYINKLKQAGFKIVFITNRGIKDDDYTGLIVPVYLKNNNILYDEIITKANDKYIYLNDCDYFIDDDIKNCCDALENSSCKVIMYETSKTKNYDNKEIFKATNWEDIYNYIMNI